jgi:hypothetical protein
LSSDQASEGGDAEGEGGTHVDVWVVTMDWEPEAKVLNMRRSATDGRQSIRNDGAQQRKWCRGWRQRRHAIYKGRDVVTGRNKLGEFEIGKFRIRCVRFPAWLVYLVHLVAPGRCLLGTAGRDSSHVCAVESAWKRRHRVE